MKARVSISWSGAWGRVCLGLGVLGGWGMLGPDAGAAPETISIQGKLERADGTPLTGERMWRVGFFDAADRGTQVGGDLTGTVTVSEAGRFAIAVVPPVEALDTEPLFYDLAVDSAETPDGVIGAEDAFAGRVQLHSVPYALRVGPHSHAGEELTTGTVAEGRIDAAVARDSEIVPAVLAADGAGSGLDADLLDGQQAAAFAGAGHSHAGHTHAGEDIDAGTVADARIASTIARDNEIVPAVLAADGAGSGLDADLLDGQQATAFAGAGHGHSGGDLDAGTVGAAAIADHVRELVFPASEIDVSINNSGTPAVVAIIGSQPLIRFDPNQERDIFISFRVPPDWDGTSSFDVEFAWGTGQTTGVVVWDIEYGVVGTGDPYNGPAATSLTDIFATTDPTATELVIAGPRSIPAGDLEVGDLVTVNLIRRATAGGDTMTSFASVVVVVVKYTAMR